MGGHPSHDCDQAWFLFAVDNHRGPGFCRLLLVEAKSHAAVAFLEHAAGEDQRVSPTCRLMTVHRQCPTIGIRSDLAEEVPLRDFAADIVDRARIAGAARDALAEALSAGGAPPAPAAAARDDAAAESDRESVLSALVNLGYPKASAVQRLRPHTDKAGRIPLEDLLTLCLREDAP